MTIKSTQCFLWLLTIFFSQNLIAQDTLRSRLSKSERICWHVFNNELAFDVQDIFFNNNGTTLIYKKRLDKGQFVRVQQTKARRFLLGFDVKRNSNPDTSQSFQSFIPTDARIEANHQNYTNIYLGIGHEIQQNFGRFQFYYGGDFFLGYNEGRNLIYQANLLGFNFSGNDYYFNNTGKLYNRRFMTGLLAFGGIRFFIHPRISLSTEGGVGFGYALVQSKRGEEEKGYDHFFQVASNPKRFLTINIHF